MRAVGLSLLVIAAAVGGCTGGDGNAETVVAPTTTAASASTVETTTDDTTTEETTPVEPTLTHAAFIRRLDRICRKGNDLAERRLGDALDAAIAANDYERIADLFRQVSRIDRRGDRAHMRLLDQVSPEDKKAYTKYIALSEELDNYRERYIRALRGHDDDEISRLNGLDDRARTRRTRLTAQMGLTRCGM